MIDNAILLLLLGSLFGCGLTLALRHVLQARRLKKNLAEDRAIIYEYSRRLSALPVRSDPGGQVLAAIKQGARTLLASAEIVAAEAERASRSAPGAAVEYENGLRVVLGTIKGLLDGADLTRLAAVGTAEAVGDLHAQALLAVERLAAQLRRYAGRFGLEAEADRLTLLVRGVTADKMIVSDDPLTVVRHLASQLRVANEAAEALDRVLRMDVRN